MYRCVYIRCLRTITFYICMFLYFWFSHTLILHCNSMKNIVCFVLFSSCSWVEFSLVGLQNSAADRSNPPSQDLRHQHQSVIISQPTSQPSLLILFGEWFESSAHTEVAVSTQAVRWRWLTGMSPESSVNKSSHQDPSSNAVSHSNSMRPSQSKSFFSFLLRKLSGLKAPLLSRQTKMNWFGVHCYCEIYAHIFLHFCIRILVWIQSSVPLL